MCRNVWGFMVDRCRFTSKKISVTSDSSETSFASVFEFCSSHWSSINLHRASRLCAFLLESEIGNKKSDLLQHFLLPTTSVSHSWCCCCGLLSWSLSIVKKNQKTAESGVTEKTKSNDEKDRRRNQNKDSSPRSATVEFWKLALTIAKEDSNQWGASYSLFK